MNAVIRHAGPEDIPALVGLLRLLFSIEQDGQVIGMCTGQLLISTAQGGPSALIEDVAVLPAHQGIRA